MLLLSSTMNFWLIFFFNLIGSNHHLILFYRTLTISMKKDNHIYNWENFAQVRTFGYDTGISNKCGAPTVWQLCLYAIRDLFLSKLNERVLLLENGMQVYLYKCSVQNSLKAMCFTLDKIFTIDMSLCGTYLHNPNFCFSALCCDWKANFLF